MLLLLTVTDDAASGAPDLAADLAGSGSSCW